MTRRTVIAVDLGAESGRVMGVHFDGRSLQAEEFSRFPNGPVMVRGTLYWNFLRLWTEIQGGIAKAREFEPASIGVDTWGVDFGLLDEQGHLLGNPVGYRDDRTLGMMEVVFARVPREEVFACTGIQFMRLNTLYQLMSLVEGDSRQLKTAARLLMAPDILNYWLTGEQVSEYTIASTTQMLDVADRQWARELLERLRIPTHLLPPLVDSGTQLGRYQNTPVIATASHDTASAVAAVPAKTEHYAYISSGTWSLLGLETREPIVSNAALAANVTNEGGVYGTYRLLKNLMGLWIVQQCRATWRAQGQDYTYGELVALAREAPPLRSLVDVNDPAFLPPGDHVQVVRELCARTGQPLPDTPGAVVRTVLESLALAYRATLDALLAISGRRVEVIHIVGGGIQNELLNQMTADATGRPVLAGPIEATVLGNALVQLISLGELRSIAEGRRMLADMAIARRYEPQETAVWEDALARYRDLTSRQTD